MGFAGVVCEFPRDNLLKARLFWHAGVPGAPPSRFCFFAANQNATKEPKYVVSRAICGSRGCVGKTLVRANLLRRPENNLFGALGAVRVRARTWRKKKEFVCAKQIAVGFSDFTKEGGKREASAPFGQRAGVNQCGAQTHLFGFGP